MYFKSGMENTTKVLLVIHSLIVFVDQPLSGLRQYLKVISWIPSANCGWLAKYGGRVFFGFCGSLWFLGNSP